MAMHLRCGGIVAVPDKKEVAKKLRAFGAERFGTMKDFAAALGMNPVTLHSGYLNSRSFPGPVLLVKLMRLGCDIHWLLAGDERGAPVSVDFYLPKKNVQSNT